MFIIACLDDNDGMLFHKRRQSKDRVVIRTIMNFLKGKQLWMNAYSSELFSEYETGNIQIQDDFLLKAPKEAVCFVENVSLKAMEEQIEKVIIFRWNRVYPADTYFDLDLDQYEKISTSTFDGSSHEITMEVYDK